MRPLFVLIFLLSSCTFIEQTCTTDVELIHKSGKIDTITVNGKTPHFHSNNGCLYAQHTIVVCDLVSVRKLKINCK